MTIRPLDEPSRNALIRECCYRRYDPDIAAMVSGANVMQPESPQNRLDKIRPKPIKHQGNPRQPELVFSISMHG